jgi:hypothetical protein
MISVISNYQSTVTLFYHYLLSVDLTYWQYQRKSINHICLICHYIQKALNFNYNDMISLNFCLVDKLIKLLFFTSVTK